MLGLPDFPVPEADKIDAEQTIEIGTDADLFSCPHPVVVATAKGRIDGRASQPGRGRPAPSRCLLTDRAGREATKEPPDGFATGIVDLVRRIVIDVVSGNSAPNIRCALDRKPRAGMSGATDLAESHRSALDGRLIPRSRSPTPFKVVPPRLSFLRHLSDPVPRRRRNWAAHHPTPTIRAQSPQ